MVGVAKVVDFITEGWALMAWVVKVIEFNAFIAERWAWMARVIIDFITEGWAWIMIAWVVKIVIPSPTKLQSRPSFRNILVTTLESTYFHGFWPNLVHT
jgi:hypothetical protein